MILIQCYPWFVFLYICINWNVWISVKRYDYIVNGEAMKEIVEYVQEEHTFAEYQTVSINCISISMYLLTKVIEKKT